MKTFFLTPDNEITFKSVGDNDEVVIHKVPYDSANNDFKEYEAWVDAGNVAQPLESPTELGVQRIFLKNADLMARIDKLELKLIRQLAKNNAVKIQEIKDQIIVLLNNLEPPGNW